jgi:hypothetical protein
VSLRYEFSSKLNTTSRKEDRKKRGMDFKGVATRIKVAKMLEKAVKAAMQESAAQAAGEDDFAVDEKRASSRDSKYNRSRLSDSDVFSDSGVTKVFKAIFAHR